MHTTPANLAGVFEVKGGNAAPDLKNSPDEAETIVTKALADFQKAVDDRLKALEGKQADGKEVETKQADADKITACLDAFEAKLNRPAVITGNNAGELSDDRKAFIEFARKGVEAWNRRLLRRSRSRPMTAAAISPRKPSRTKS
jgi:hypothetical protein